MPCCHFLYSCLEPSACIGRIFLPPESYFSYLTASPFPLSSSSDHRETSASLRAAARPPVSRSPFLMHHAFFFRIGFVGGWLSRGRAQSFFLAPSAHASDFSFPVPPPFTIFPAAKAPPSLSPPNSRMPAPRSTFGLSALSRHPTGEARGPGQGRAQGEAAAGPLVGGRPSSSTGSFPRLPPRFVMRGSGSVYLNWNTVRSTLPGFPWSSFFLGVRMSL